MEMLEKGSEKCLEFRRYQVLDVWTWDALKEVMAKITETNKVTKGKSDKKDEKKLKNRILETQGARRR